MPNGGSDCCGTCWFNSRNQREAARTAAPAVCTIRNLVVASPFYTYCANHPHRRPDRDAIPIGPVYTGDHTGLRTLWQQSPDTEEVRQHLLDLLDAIAEPPATEYPMGIYTDEVVVWQLGEFREPRAVNGLRSVLAFDPSAAEAGPFGRTRAYLVHIAREALLKITGDGLP